MLTRYRPLRGQPYPTGPFVADIRSHDIPETMCACVRNAPAHCVAITFRVPGFPIRPAKTIAAVERIARRKGVRIIWVPFRAAMDEPISSEQ